MDDIQRKSKVWLEFIASLSPCCQLCQGRFWRDLHHIKGLCHCSGASMKAPDFLTVPVCKECHEVCHDDPTVQPAAFKRTWVLAINSGRLVASDPPWTEAAVSIYKNLPWPDEKLALRLMKEWALYLDTERGYNGLQRVAWTRRNDDFCSEVAGWYALCGSRSIFPGR